MSTILLEDKAGKTIRLLELNGRRFPIFPEDSLKHATEIEARPDDVLLVSFPKSGTHWTAAILRHLIDGNTEGVTDEKFDNHFVDQGDRDTIKGLPSPRLLYSHFHSDTISQDYLRKKCKLVYVTRNPRDVVTSIFHHHRKLQNYYNYDGDWDGHLQMFLEGKMDYDSWFEHTKGWEKYIKNHPERPSLIMSYESIKEDPSGNIKKIVDFIGTNHSEEFLKEVETRTSFKSMAQDQKTERDKVYFRKGQVGDWKNHFTVAQSEIFNDVFEKEMEGTDVYKQYSHTVEK